MRTKQNISNTFITRVAILPSLITTLFTVLLFASLSAQTADSLKILREFIAVNSALKKLPLQMQLEFKQAGGNRQNGDSTVTLKGDFVINKNGAYINFGTMEQIINDSIVLVIMKDTRQMLLSENDKSTMSYTNTMMAPQFNDTDILKVAAVYSVQKIKNNKKNSEIKINSRQMIEEVALPAMSISVQYDEATKLPAELMVTRRTLIKVPVGIDTAALSKRVEKNITTKWVTIGNDSYLLKETSSQIVYSKIDNQDNVPLPVLIEDRIKSINGSWQPVDAYKSFQLINHLQQ